MNRIAALATATLCLTTAFASQAQSQGAPSPMQAPPSGPVGGPLIDL